MKKLIKYLIGLILLVLIAFGFYLFNLRSLAKEANAIFGLRCTKVNPNLIGYKNSFLKMADCLKNYKDDACTSDEVLEYFDNYILGMRLYVPEEDTWLKTQRKFMESWRFKVFAPEYIKQGIEYQWKMYEGYRDDAKYMLETYDTKGSSEAAEKFNEARQKRNDYGQKYFELTEEVASHPDWRLFITNLPYPEGCTEELLTIPETAGALDEETPDGIQQMINPEEGPIS
jgi:hypothetical protein